MISSKHPFLCVPKPALCQNQPPPPPRPDACPQINTVRGQTGWKFVLFQSSLHAIPLKGIRNKDHVCTFGFTSL